MAPRNKQPTITEWIASGVEKGINEVHVCLPAIIDTFDATTQTAKVLPAIQRIRLSDGEFFDIPPITNVPVQFPSAGGFSLTFPVKKGDEVLLVFGERSIDTWQQSGGIQQPLDRRKHDYTDAIAIIGLHSKGRAVESYSTDSVDLRSDDGEYSVSIKSDSVEIKASALGGATFNNDGSVTFANGASITALGGFVNGPLAGANGLGTHVHPSIGAPPTPGT
jgi:hypothetical protein